MDLRRRAWPGRRGWLAVPRSRLRAIQPASMRVQPFSSVADDGGEDREGDVVQFADADAGHDEVEEDEDAGADFGDAVEFFGEVRGRGGADADDGASKPAAAQALGGADGAGALLLGDGAQRRRRGSRRSRRRGS